jgi:cytochrome b561
MSSRVLRGAPVREGYGLVARLFHWVVALLVLVTIPIGLSMLRVGQGPLQDRLFALHRGIGVILIAFVARRILRRLTHRPPPLDGLPGWQARAAHLNHLLLYIMLVVQMTSGYVFTVFGGFPIELFDALGVPYQVTKNEALSKAAEAVHLVGWIVILVLVVLHIGAALYHGLVRRDGIVSGMWRGTAR